ncbi:protocadherin beta-5-like [Monodon monoceros]|uniref:protocadherin beta-5-like n=1 Tax=Monodon monoceros TaxID=40151 RepID=UPI0010F9CD6F|nr:protocadherin beta-5-like [Monodon monoceros]
METAPAKTLQKRQVIFLAILLLLWEPGSEAVRYSMPEETESGSFVATLAKDLGLRVGELATRGARIHYKGNKQLLQLDVTTGNLLLYEKLDREVLCGATDPCILHFQLLLENPVQFFQADLQLTDINDHSPEFLEREMLLKIPENVQTGTVFPLKIAQDFDIGSNTIQNYTISPNSHFHVVTHNRGDGRKYPELVLDKPLDREEGPELSLTLTALDSGAPPRSGTTAVRIEVVDINDNAPEFLQSVYEVQIPENSPLNSLVVAVSARDLDAGTNGNVAYALFQGDEATQPFVIDEITGEIRLKRALDFEATRYYNVEIAATDGGGLSGKCTVVIKVVDVNDNVPELTMSTLTSSTPENSPETVVAVFSVSDPDSGDNGRMVCSIQNDLPFLLKPTFKNFYTLVTERPLDRESRAEYNVTITVTDMGTPRLKTQHNITIVVLDINDNAPEFAQEFYEAQVPENSSLGSLVLTVSARDLDAGSFGEVSYALFQVDDVNQPFELNANTGEIRLRKTLDFEEFQSYQVDVEATDGGGLSGKCSLVIKVLDVNDNAPELTMSSLTNPIPENLPEIIVAVFSVSDADSGHNQQVTCSIDDNLPFLLRPSVENFYTLVTEGALDRESRAEYNITITVTDMGTPRLKTEHNITLLLEKPLQIFRAELWVRDINDHSSVFLDREIPLKILEVTTPGAAFLLESAQDSDVGTNNLRNYTISPNAYFHIHVHDSGEGIIYPELVLDRLLDQEEVPELSLLLTALDGGSPPSSGTALVCILVLDINDNAPEFVQSLYKVQVTEDSLVVSLVVTMSARDLDTGSNGEIVYAFFYATERILKTFQINPTSGNLHLKLN